MTGQTGNDGTKSVEIMVPLKYLSNFRRTLEIPLTDCETNLILTWSANCVIVYTHVANHNATFEITDTELHVPLITLSIHYNTKLLVELDSAFKRGVN